MDYEELQKPPRNCLNCGRPVYGRADKMFCGDVCKNTYHNIIRLSERRRRAIIIQQLDLNYNILRNAVSCGMVNMVLERAAQMGFKREFCTHCTINGRTACLRCYDIEYILTPKRILHIHFVDSR